MVEDKTYEYRTLERDFGEFVGQRAAYRTPSDLSSRSGKVLDELEALYDQIKEALPDKLKHLVYEIEKRNIFLLGDSQDWYYKKGFIDGIGLYQSIHG